MSTMPPIWRGPLPFQVASNPLPWEGLELALLYRRLREAFLNLGMLGVVLANLANSPGLGSCKPWCHQQFSAWHASTMPTPQCTAEWTLCLINQ